MRDGELPIESYIENKEVKRILTEEEEYEQFRMSYKEPDASKYAAAITEVGMCQTTSQYSEYTNPYGKM